MTNQLDLRLFLFLLIASSLATGQQLLKDNLQNSTVSNHTQQNDNTTELQPTGRLPQTTGIRNESFTAAPTPSRNTSETTHSWPSQGNGTSGNTLKIEGTETNTTEHKSTGNESLVTESPPQSPLPEKNGTSDPTISIGANGTNATNSVTAVPPPHSSTGGPTRSKTTIKTTSIVRTTSSHTPTTAHHSQKPDKPTTRICPTAEPKKEGLVGQCLIAIASLAALATIFIMTTIVFATKLAGLRQRHRASLLHGTEMVCISALMNDTDYPIPTPKHPKSNGALIPITEDEDGDDLTLNSFLHDTEVVA
ncbi:P-selectin glycoprotein ligand 1 precursor [Silurus asotus]|uniref:P-selectin glycoprotein ligand 1 n=1 Tax=Silurus asotus TaxID=30991 RepID=A0AAD5AYG8_SILAS|nr:P-selectin glycoprotein ligand 1 precursor [Silurus asotus]